MFGNRATGSVSIVIPPTMTMRMAITIATIGRLIKNLDIELFPFWLRVGLRHEGLGLHLHSRTHFLRALGDDAFAGFQTFRNDPLAADRIADFDGLNAHFVLAIHNRDLIAALQL